VLPRASDMWTGFHDACEEEATFDREAPCVRSPYGVPISLMDGYPIGYPKEYFFAITNHGVSLSSHDHSRRKLMRTS
jgi:hypothetical protein